MQLIARTRENIHSPIGEAFALLDQREDTRPLLDMSQAAPSHPTAPQIADRIAAIARSPDGGRYCPQEGLPHLREAFATELSSGYGASVSAANVLVTAGCNQAFCLVASTLAGKGDQIILPRPFYFNHDMWLRLDGIEPVHMATTDEGLPDIVACRSLITERTAAIVLVTPGNPTGTTIGPSLIAEFAEVARSNDVALILDETYRSYRNTTAPAHEMFSDPDWEDTVVSLHSFSKEFAIPGYRVGAAVGSPVLLAEAMKLLDCVAICAPRIGQEAAHAGLTEAIDWRAEKVAAVADRQERFEQVMAGRPGGFELTSSGAYFGWVRHPFEGLASTDVVRRLLVDHSMLTIPGHAFTGSDDGFIRFSFANLPLGDFDELEARLASVALS